MGWRHLWITRVLIARITMPGELIRSQSFETGAGEFITDQVALHLEQVREAPEEILFDALLARIAHQV